VPPGAIRDSPSKEGTADESKEAITRAGKKLTSIHEGIPHSAVFQTDPKSSYLSAKETAVGCSSFDLCDAADGVERRR
jgi:hypothetical protein